MDNYSIKVRNYKCFGDEPQGFDTVKPINIIIGKNNSGKSSLLDIIEFLTTNIGISQNFKNNKQSEIVINANLKKDEITKLNAEFHRNELSRYFSNTNGAEEYLESHHIQFKFTKDIPYDINIDGMSNGVKFDSYLKWYRKHLRNPLKNYKILKINSERDIVPEGKMPNYNLANIKRDGKGITQVIELQLNRKGSNNEIIEDDFLKILNKILMPEICIDQIKVLDDTNGIWEIHLNEGKKGQIPLSFSGSGLKTIIQLLVNTEVLPKLSSFDMTKLIFSFEELENNIHPALERKLLYYIKEYAEKHGCLFFITTHSPTVIDVFSNDENAQILHVTHDGEKAEVNTVHSFNDKNSIFTDLDVRASDLLQTNCIIWVEGPTDRIYIKTWIDLYSKNKIREGKHYQFIYYGGSILKHYNIDDEDFNIDDFVNMLKINKNSIVVMDKDTPNKLTKKYQTKIRVKKEVEKFNGVSWITNGREIENYIPQKILSKFIPELKNKRSLRNAENMKKYFEEFKITKWKRFNTYKLLFAKEIVKLFTAGQFENDDNLALMVGKVCKKIKEVNNLEEF